MSIYRIGHGSPQAHARNERRAVIVRQHRKRMLEELRELEQANGAEEASTEETTDDETGTP